MTTTIVGLFKNVKDADRAIHELKQQGLDEKEISLMAQQKAIQTPSDNHQPSEEVVEGAIIGAAGGATVGGFAGMLTGLGALVIPGVGPVLAAGTLAAFLGSTAAGAGIGAVAGGLVLGALAKLGLPDEEAHLYAEGVKRGGYLVTVQTDQEHASKMREIMRQAKAVDLSTTGKSWQREGWRRFDETAEPDETYPRL